jgi:hypothetical protein
LVDLLIVGLDFGRNDGIASFRRVIFETQIKGIVGILFIPVRLINNKVVLIIFEP